MKQGHKVIGGEKRRSCEKQQGRKGLRAWDARSHKKTLLVIDVAKRKVRQPHGRLLRRSAEEGQERTHSEKDGKPVGGWSLYSNAEGHTTVGTKDRKAE